MYIFRWARAARPPWLHPGPRVGCRRIQTCRFVSTRRNNLCLVETRCHILVLSRNDNEKCGPGAFWIIVGPTVTPNQLNMSNRDISVSGYAFSYKNKCPPHITRVACLHRLGLLRLPRLGSASLALLAPATTAAGLLAARPLKAAKVLLRGAGKASEADPRLGKPSMPRPARQGKARSARPAEPIQNHDLQKQYFVIDLAPGGSKWDFDGIAW